MQNSHGITRSLILSAMLAVLVILAVLWASRSAHGGLAWAKGPANDTSAENHVTWHKAASTKRSLGGRVLMLDIRRAVTSDPDATFDARAPFVDQDADDNGQMRFHAGFALQADEALRAAHLTHGTPVFLVCDNSRCGDLAAVLLHEHGYERLFVISDPEQLARRAGD